MEFISNTRRLDHTETDPAPIPEGSIAAETKTIPNFCGNTPKTAEERFSYLMQRRDPGDPPPAPCLTPKKGSVVFNRSPSSIVFSLLTSDDN